MVDIVAVLSESKNPTDYLKKIRKRDDELKTYIGTNCPQKEALGLVFQHSGYKEHYEEMIK